MTRIEKYEEGGRTWNDDASISDDEILLRRIPPWQVYWDKQLGRYRPSSQAFDDDDEGDPMSVYLTSVMEELGLSAERTLDDQAPGFGVAGILAGIVRDASQVVQRDAKPGLPIHVCDPAHAVVAGAKGGKKRSKVGKKFHWVVPPPNATEPPPA